MNNENKTKILRYFSPRWFIAIMGTGAVANILQMLSGQKVGFLHQAAASLLMVAVAAFPIALGLLISRIFIDRETLGKELRHSSLVQFYSAIFIAAAICATGLIKIPLPQLDQGLVLWTAKIYWGLALVIGLGLSLFTPWRIITLNHGEPRRILGFWFLPPVGLFVLVFSGNFLALKTGAPAWINTIGILNLNLLGVATVLSVMLYTLFFFRGLAYPFPKGDVIPSFTIGLAPIGVSIIAFHSQLPVIMEASSLSFIPVSILSPLISVLSILLWGFGFWWLFLTVCITFTAVTRQKIPVTLGYWAFIFPPAAFTLASLILGKSTSIAFIQNSAFVLSAAVILGWFMVSILTIRGIFNRSIFKLPPSFSEIMESPSDGSKVQSKTFQGKFPLCYLTVPKTEHLSSIEQIAESLRTKIQNHPVATYIKSFDHHSHTQSIAGEIHQDIIHAHNLIFCFGPKLENSHVMGIRPRSFGIAEFDQHFDITFMEAPSEKATQTMKDWVEDLIEEALLPRAIFKPT